jgi:hypothetical protein
LHSNVSLDSLAFTKSVDGNNSKYKNDKDDVFQLLPSPTKPATNLTASSRKRDDVLEITNRSNSNRSGRDKVAGVSAVAVKSVPTKSSFSSTGPASMMESTFVMDPESELALEEELRAILKAADATKPLAVVKKSQHSKNMPPVLKPIDAEDTPLVSVISGQVAGKKLTVRNPPRSLAKSFTTSELLASTATPTMSGLPRLQALSHSQSAADFGDIAGVKVQLKKGNKVNTMKK